MLIDELIDKLKAIKAIHGNIPVMAFPYDGQMQPSDIESVVTYDKVASKWDKEKGIWEWVDYPISVCLSD